MNEKHVHDLLLRSHAHLRFYYIMNEKNVHDLLLHSEIVSKLAFPHYAFIIL
jgi:hypothetical protein